MPVGFSDDQRRATIAAARNNVPNVRQVRLLEEPIAAAMAFGLHDEYRGAASGVKNVVVFDFGGGTLDVALIDFDVNNDGFVVVGAGGDDRLGGEDFDRAIADALLVRCGLANPWGGTVPVDLLAAAERAKQTLSAHEASTVDVHIPWPADSATRVDGGGEGCTVTAAPNATLRLRTHLARADMESAVGHLVVRMKDAVTRVLDEHDTAPERVDDVVLVGGSSRMHVVMPALRLLFGPLPRLRTDVDADTAIALGAARSFGCSRRS